MKAQDILKALSFNTFIPFFYPSLMLPLRYYRKRAIRMLNFSPGDMVILPGVGSGHDLPLLPKNIKVEGVDISESMLTIAKAKLKVYGLERNVHLNIMDAENLGFPNNIFDKAILSLFLTCVFDQRKAFAEVVRVVKPGCEILIYDHLVRKKKWSQFFLEPFDVVMKYNFCSVIRTIESCIEDQPVSIVKVLPGDPLGFIKAFLLRKNATSQPLYPKSVSQSLIDKGRVAVQSLINKGRAAL
jgi:phosphatidylethanolamine/phosphatidyl-N-methylethanolamine N-methyltransferase